MATLDALDYNPRWWKGKRVLITGITGFLGYNLARSLIGLEALVYGIVRDYDPSLMYFQDGFVIRSVEGIVTGDIRDYNLVKRAVFEFRPDVTFHLAALTQVVDAKRDPKLTYETNIMGTVNVLEAFREWKNCGDIDGLPPEPIVVVASSDKAYGEASWPADEGTQFEPIHPYDVSKASVDIIAQSYGQYYGMNVVITRCGNFYGPGDVNWDRLIPGALRWIIDGEVVVLRSDGKQIREYNYVYDMVDGYLRSAQAIDPFRADRALVQPGEAFNLSNHEGLYSALDLMEIMKEIFHDFPVRTLDIARDETKKIILDSERSRRILGWEPKTSIREGLMATYKWLKIYLAGDL